MNRLSRRTALAGSAALLALSSLPARAEALPVFYRSPGCGCCHVWAERMKDAGLPVNLTDSGDLSGLSAKLGVAPELQGCHVGEIGGYVISGHVPPEDIKRLLAERPTARRLAVPGMPMGSPGMETDGPGEAFDVLLLKAGGTTAVFARHG